MQELDTIDLPDGRRGTIVYVHPSAQMIIVEAGPELIDYEVHENGLKETSRITVGPEDLPNRLIEGEKAADQGDTINVTDWTRQRICEPFLTNHRRIEKLVRIAATEGVEAALEHLDGTPEEDDEVHGAALRALDDDERDRE